MEVRAEQKNFSEQSTEARYHPIDRQRGAFADGVDKGKFDGFEGDLCRGDTPIGFRRVWDLGYNFTGFFKPGEL